MPGIQAVIQADGAPRLVRTALGWMARSTTFEASTLAVFIGSTCPAYMAVVPAFEALCGPDLEAIDLDGRPPNADSSACRQSVSHTSGATDPRSVSPVGYSYGSPHTDLRSLASPLQGDAPLNLIHIAHRLESGEPHFSGSRGTGHARDIAERAPQTVGQTVSLHSSVPSVYLDNKSPVGGLANPGTLYRNRVS